MLTRFDDFPIHQVPVPVAHTGTTDRNHYDRYFFNGFLPQGELFFGGAMGRYPNRHVIDAGFSVVKDGRQVNLHVSGRAPVEPTSTEVGPVRVEVLEPMDRIRLRVDAEDHGLAADLTFAARAVAVEEERQMRTHGSVPVMDVTRFTQNGSWEGWIRVDGQQVDLDPTVARGTRDRSWGIRPVGEPPGGAPPSGTPQIFWLWAPLNFRDRCTYVAIFDDADGTRFYQHCLVAPARRAPTDPVIDPGGIAERMRDTTFAVEWEPGTRRARSAAMTLVPVRGEAHELTFEVLYTFQMCGLGYSHPEWAHGTWRGELEVQRSQWELSEVDPMARQNLHIQNMCRVRLDGEESFGILEQIAVGPHHPTGLTGVLDPFEP